MKRLMLTLIAGAFGLAAGTGWTAETPVSQETTVVGYLLKVQTAADGKSATATLLVKGKKVDIFVKDDLTLNKFKIKKIRNDDEIRCKYHAEDGKNVSDSFKRTAGC